MKFSIILIFFLPLNAISQSVDNLDDRINGLTTIVESRIGTKINQGSGFFYYTFMLDTPKKGGRYISDVFLITNRHVIFHKDTNGKERIPDNITFYLRSFKDSISWSPITLSKSKFQNIIGVDKNPSIDIAVIEIAQLIPKEKNLFSDSTFLAKFNGVYEEMFPNKNTPIPHVSSDIIAVGYPKGYYDHKNLFPIVKSGIIASKWGAFYNGNPYFLIDCKLFPASSGSLILSKPTNFVSIHGHISGSPIASYNFLGIYSGELSNKEQQDIGVVWYGNLIKEIINKGILFSE